MLTGTVTVGTLPARYALSLTWSMLARTSPYFSPVGLGGLGLVIVCWKEYRYRLGMGSGLRLEPAREVHFMHSLSRLSRKRSRQVGLAPYSPNSAGALYYARGS